MVPILSSVIASYSKENSLTVKKSFLLSLVYVLSMSVAYAIAGVLSAYLGQNIQGMLQNRYVIYAFSAIFVLLSLSMFGLFKLQLPASLQSFAQQKRGSGYVFVAIMGFLSALIVGPCIAAPLAGALVYISQTQDVLLGGGALFCLSFGMGVPLLLVGLGAGKYMPKPGKWMDKVSKFFGILLLLLAVWMLERVVENFVIIYVLYSIVAIIFTLLFVNNNIVKIISILFIIGNIYYVYNLALSKKSTPIKVVQISQANFEKFLFSNQYVMVDFWAKWCTSCKEMEHTLQNPKVQQELKKYKLLKIDLTNPSKEHSKIIEQYNIFGPPAILLFENGVVVKKIIGYKSVEQFLEIIKK
jgi:thiol:disulfide interchange protein DsbD